MRHFVRILIVAAVALSAWPLRAMYVPFDLEQVPIARLVENLEAAAKARPQDVWVQINLGRAHAMAYAYKTETIRTSIQKYGNREMAPFVAIEDPDVPFRAQPTDDSKKMAAALAHLKVAVDHFRKAIELSPTHAVARISLGWCLEQSGDRDGAIAAYRDVIARGWPADGRVVFERFTAGEAAGYLIPLLDSAKDAAEIAKLRQIQAKVSKMMRPVTPVAIPLRDGLRLADVVDDEAAVRFDADGSGLPKSWTWITPNAAWLVYDQKGRGEIGSALQLFGSVTFWMFWNTGYDAMRALDDDGDGRLAGSELRHLGLWRDANSNGISERGEVRPLVAYDIVSLGLDYAHMDDADRTPFVVRGVSFRDGSTRPTWDVILQPAR